MNTRLSVVCVFAVLVCLAMTSLAFAQENNYPNIIDAKPMFVAGPPHLDLAPQQPNASLVQWNGTFKDLLGRTVNYTMVGGNPSTTNTTTTVPVYIIPIKLVYGPNNGNHTFDPNTALPGGQTVIQNIVASPIFNPGVNFTQGGKNLGTTQYIDAFQRGNFWKFVKSVKHNMYHVLLGQPTILTTQTINVAVGQGQVINNPFGNGIVGTYDINLFDSQLQTYMRSFNQINPGVLPLFITYDVYLTSGGCCIGGYHNANGVQPGGQTYSHATYVDSHGAFSQDVSALSHEIGEWMDDPFVDNRVNCTDNSILEVGDPLEGHANYGAFPYTLNGFTYNLQSLVFLPYFGAPKNTSLLRWYSFQNDETHFCPGQ
jgi:hypothetical protein